MGWNVSKPILENWLESLKGPKATITSAIDTSGEILKRIPDLPDFMDKANHALQLIAEGKLNLTKSSNTTLEMEKLRLKSFRNNILIIIGGGISAYKSLDLLRFLKKGGYEIKTVLTRSGKQFVTPLSLASLSGGKVYENLFDKENEAEIDHISLSRWADLILVVPATANIISRLSHGKAEDLASTILLASNKDIVLVPAMNVRMWGHRATQENCKKLITYGYKFLGPTEGQMACGEFGKGKMLSPKKIYTEIKNYFYKRNIVKNKKFKALVTTGPTREYLDPVRFISNESSGKQGYEIALALKRMGVKTTLIAGPSNLQIEKGLKVIKVKT